MQGSHNVQDPTELSLGISAFLGAHPGFSAISKARYSDFVVREVDVSGRQARLDSIEPVVASSESDEKLEKKENGERKRKQPDGDDEAVVVDWETLQLELSNMVPPEASQEVVKFLQSKQGGNEEETRQFVVLSSLTEKDKRRQLHHWIREHLSTIALADTIENHQIRIWHISHKHNMPNKLENRNNNNNKRRCKYLQFVLYKENVDTGAALHILSKRLSHGKRRQAIRMGYAGNKDKRGVTCQFVTVPSSIPLHVFKSINSRGQGGGGHTASAGAQFLQLGNFEYTDTELRLGRLSGNRFDVILRNVQCCENNNTADVLEQAITSLRENGFVNYFGTQRFGKDQDTHEVGMAVVRGDFQQAVELIVSPKSGERDESVRQALERFQSRFDGVAPDDRARVEKERAQQACKVMNRFMHSESAVLNSLVKFPLDYKKAFSCITKTMRMMFVHALQSYLWNKAASYRFEKLGTTVVPGDLVVLDDSKEGIPAVDVVTAENIDKYNIQDVVLPLIGAQTRDPDSECSKVFDDVLKESNVTREMLVNLKDRDFNCAGDYRKLVCRPTDVNFDMIRYDDELQPLLQTDFMKLKGIPVKGPKDESPPLLAMRVGFTLSSSSYATIFLRELMKRPTSMGYQKDLKLGERKEEEEEEEAVDQ